MRRQTELKKKRKMKIRIAHSSKGSRSFYPKITARNKNTIISTKKVLPMAMVEITIAGYPPPTYSALQQMETLRGNWGSRTQLTDVSRKTGKLSFTIWYYKSGQLGGRVGGISYHIPKQKHLVKIIQTYNIQLLRTLRDDKTITTKTQCFPFFINRRTVVQ
jgi:hypothetical protein